MAKYIAIIELHGAENEEDFQQLDAALKERQFFPQIRDDDGEAYWLPTGSYAIQNTDMVLKAAHDAAVGAAGESGFEFSVIVTGFDQCEWTTWLQSRHRLAQPNRINVDLAKPLQL